MKSLSRVGVGLSVIFGCLFFALFAELYYLLWWKKKRVIIVAANGPSSIERGHPDFDPKSFQRQGNGDVLASDKGLLQFKPPEQDRAAADGQGTELYKIPDPPRLLFTIVEETKEDLESDDGKSGTAKVKRSLSDYLAAVESKTPYLTPVTSPSLFTPDGTGTGNHRRPNGGFDPGSFESCRDAEFNRKRCSPPPTFKFLQDAEEKLRRKSDQCQKLNGTGENNKSPPSLRLAEAGRAELITLSTSK